MKTKQVKNIGISAALAASCIWFSGCASIITSGDRTIPVTSNPTAATVTVYDKANNGVVASGITPAKIKLKKGAGYFKGAEYRLVVEKTGYQPREFQITHDINGWYWGNFFLGGALGLVVVDPLTGGMWVLKPDKIDAELTATSACVDGQKLSVLTPDQLTPEQRQQLAGLRPAVPPQTRQ